MKSEWSVTLPRSCAILHSWFLTKNHCFNLWWRSSGHANNRAVDVCPVGIAVLFVGLAVTHMEGYVLSSGQCHVVGRGRGEILWIGRRPGGNERLCPCGLWELLQCRTLWAFFILLHASCWCYCQCLGVTHRGEGLLIFNRTTIGGSRQTTNDVKYVCVRFVLGGGGDFFFFSIFCTFNFHYFAAVAFTAHPDVLKC